MVDDRVTERERVAELARQFEEEVKAGDSHQWAAGDILLQLDKMESPEVLAKRLYRYEKSYLSKLRSTCREFVGENRTKAIKAGATFHDCYQVRRLMARSEIVASEQPKHLVPLLNKYLSAKKQDASTAFAAVLAEVAPKAAERKAVEVQSFFEGSYKHPLPLTPFDKRWDRVEKMVQREARSLALSEFEGGVAVACLLQGDRPVLTGASTYGSPQRQDNALLGLALLAIRSINGDILTALGTLQSMSREADIYAPPIIDETLKARLREIAALLAVESPSTAATQTAKPTSTKKRTAAKSAT